MVGKWYFFFIPLFYLPELVGILYQVELYSVCLSVCLSICIFLSIFLFFYWQKIMDSYFGKWAIYNPLLTLLFWRSTCLRFGHYSSFQLTSVSFSMPSSFFECFILVRKHTSGSFTLPQSENQPFLQGAPHSCSGGWCSEVKAWTLGVLLALGRLSV